MTPAGARFHNFLEKNIAELKAGRVMPEAGGKRLASNFSDMMADVRKSIDSATQKVADAVKDLKLEIEDGADDAAKQLRAEAAEVRKGFGELLGNNAPPSDSTGTK